jgi:hypothetical protein
VGTEATCGPYVGFLDQDDTYQPDFLRVTTTALSRASSLDAVKVLPNVSIPLDPVRYKVIASVLVTTMLIRRAAFNIVGGWPETKPYREHPGGCEDEAFLRLFSHYFDFEIIYQKLYDHAHRPGNALDRFLGRTTVVDGQIVFAEPTEQDKMVWAELDRLKRLLRDRVRRHLLQQGGDQFVRLPERAAGE